MVVKKKKGHFRSMDYSRVKTAQLVTLHFLNLQPSIYLLMNTSLTDQPTAPTKQDVVNLKWSDT